MFFYKQYNISEIILKLMVLLSFFSCNKNDDNLANITDSDVVVNPADDDYVEEDEFVSCFDNTKSLKSIEDESNVIFNFFYNDECLLSETYNNDGKITSSFIYNQQNLIEESSYYSYNDGSIDRESISYYTYNSEKQITSINHWFKTYFDGGGTSESSKETKVEYNGQTNTTISGESKTIYTIHDDLIVGLKSYKNDTLYSEYQFFYNDIGICEKIIGSSRNFVSVIYDEFKTIEALIVYHDLPNVIYNDIKFKNNLFTVNPNKSAEDYVRDFITHQSKNYVKSMEIKIENVLSDDSYEQEIVFDNEGYPLTIKYIRSISRFTDFTKFIWE